MKNKQKFRSKTFSNKQYGSYIQVYQREDMKFPLTDFNFFEGERDKDEVEVLLFIDLATQAYDLMKLWSSDITLDWKDI